MEADSKVIEYLSVDAAAKRLKRKRRTVLEFLARGDIKSQKVINEKTGRENVVVDAGDLERFIDERSRPGTSREIAVAPAGELQKPTKTWLSMADLAGMFQAMLKPPVPGKNWLTLDEASAYCGLSRKFLLRLIFAGKLPALPDEVKRDRWRICKADLDALRGVLRERAKAAHE